MSETASAAFLRNQFAAFLQNRSGTDGLRRVLRTFQRPLWKTHLFGGLLRDVLLYGPEARPRDIDLVLAKNCIGEVCETLSHAVERRTRFGGVNLQLFGWHVDVWSLEQTWAFHEDPRLNVTFEDLPKTTFLNVDAVAMELPGPHRTVSASQIIDQIIENGFFQAMNDRVVDLNFESNPYPELCVVRGSEIAERLGFSLGPDLVAYIADHAPQTEKGIQDLIEVQRSHYGAVRLAEERLRRQLQRVRAHHRHLDQTVLSLQSPM